VTLPVTANVNVHVKVLVVPAPEKFNTFNTFNTFDTFDPVACCYCTEQSADGETTSPAVVNRLTRPKHLPTHRLTDYPTLARAILPACESSRASGADFS
jgi:hypothetical protein